MNRLLMALAALLAATAPVLAAGCNGTVEKQLKFSSADKPDTFVVESFGDTCKHARLVIYVKTATNQWAPLIVSLVNDYGSEQKNPTELRAALKDVADRIEGPMPPRNLGRDSARRDPTRRQPLARHASGEGRV
jgi:hypothetical protein